MLFRSWVSKQYNQDQHFFLHDLPTWAEDLAQFKKLAQDRRLDIVRDINRYANIAQVRAVIAQAAGTKTETNLAAKVTKLDPFVAAGQAQWWYQGNDYVIYHPRTFKASNICAHIGMKTNICTIMNPQHFASYSRNGTLLYIITADKLFNCYVSSKRRPEYADEMNDHNYDLDYMISNFPALAKILQQQFPVEIRHKETGRVLFVGVIDMSTAVKLAVQQKISLQGADLRGANLWGANLRGADLLEADLRNANLQEANLRGTNLRRASLLGADLQEANLRNANLQEEIARAHV